MPRPPQRVLMTADAIGGVWTYSMELARRLSSHNVEVRIAVMGGGLDDAKRAEAAAIHGVTLSAANYKLEWMRDPWQDVERSGDWLLQLADSFQPDIVHLNGYAHGALPWAAPVVSVAHSCVFSWFQAVRRHSPGPEWSRYRDAVRKGLQRADLVIAPSLAMLQSLTGQYGPLQRTAVIHNGTAEVPRSPLRRKDRFIFSAGRIWDDAKNLRMLTQAAPTVDWPVLVAGDDTHPEGGRKALPGVQTLGVLSRAEITERYRQAAIYALPALYEPFGYTALEAATHGCALVLSDISSLREIWDSAAKFVPPGDPGAWSEALNKLTGEPTLIESLAAAAQRRASQFTGAHMTHEYLRAYEQAEQNRSSCALSSSATRYDLTGITGTPTFSAA